jgi:hypothetical protein
MPKYRIAVIDAETDPFLHGRVIAPFCCEFLSEDHCEQFWGPDCMHRLADFLETLPERYVIFAHNGGKFDFHFMSEYLDNPIHVIKARIVSATIHHHTLRDSFAILPVPLRAYEKDTFDYDKMERGRREKHKREILEYLHSDCVSLFSLVTKFIEQFGLRLTIGGTAMREVKRRYKFQRFDANLDAIFRPYYYGGRVQCFRTGIMKGPWKSFDINSQYPYVMSAYRHPMNGTFDQTDKRPRSFKKPYFLHFEGEQWNAIPARADDGSLTFEQKRGEFFACSHELEVALDHGLVKIDKVRAAWIATETISFGDYVSEFFAMKIAAEKAGDKAGRLFAKLLLNSAYGKFGQNSANFRDYHISRDDDEHDALRANGYELEAIYPDFTLWGCASNDPESGLYDVSIAASITSAARAVLLEGLQNAREPIYCDTDSIICKSYKGATDSQALGAFKDEGGAAYAAIAGKKLYALYDRPSDTEAVKYASKGGDLSLAQILQMCRGETVTYKRDAPSFSTLRPVNSDPSKLFITRTFKMTGKPATVRNPARRGSRRKLIGKTAKHGTQSKSL